MRFARTAITELAGPALAGALALGVVLAVLPTGTAAAAQWRYCLATATARHTVYMSAPFADDESMVAIEGAFAQTLDRAQLPHDSIQCPRGDPQSIAAMKSQAIQFNQASGNKVVQLNWRP